MTHRLGRFVRWRVRARRAARRLVRRAAGLHQDQRGTISIVSVFALLMLVMLLGMVMNSSRQVDQKVRMQNAADSATWSSGQVMVRHMNSLAFTNHLLADTFALTAFMREARDRNAESYTWRIMNNWERIGPFLATSEFPPFNQLGHAINQKVPYERDMATSFGEWASAASEKTLPVLEEVLATEAIPQYQRTLADATPVLMQQAAQEVARRHAEAWPRRGTLEAEVWRTRVDPVGGMQEMDRRTMPAVDPSPYQTVTGGAPLLRPLYLRAALEQRRRLSHRYLADWNNESLVAFDRFGKMSQFASLWRNFTCGYLEWLLNVEYPDRNLPFQIRSRAESPVTDNFYLEEDYMFVGVVYQRQPSNFVPGVFKNPAAFDRQAFAQVEVFVPRRRLIRVEPGQNSTPQGMFLGGVPGGFIILPPDPAPPPPPPSDEPPPWFIVRQGNGWNPDSWDLLTQNWAAQLVPSTARNLREILSSTPYVNNVEASNIADWRSLSPDDIGNLTHH